jgi:hypothetical protein
MIKSRAARAAGLHYLEHESMELKTGDKTWKVYGSPVRLRFSEYILRLISHRQPHDTCQGPSNTNMKISQEPKVRSFCFPPYH